MKKRTMYMHTLDGKPAVFCNWHSVPTEHYVAFAGQRLRFSDLASSLRQIRREQKIAMENAANRGVNQTQWANRDRYGYVRVEVP